MNCRLRTFAPVALLLLISPLWLYGQGGVAPKTLLDPTSATAKGQLQMQNNEAQQTTTAIDKTGLAVHIKAGPAAYPGVAVRPDGTTPWDLGMYGHVEALVTNIGANPVNVGVRVDNAGDWKQEPWNSEGKTIEPGQTKTIRVYFGYSYGYRPGFKLNPQAVTQLLFYTGKQDKDVAFRVSRIQGAGWPGEKVGIDPDRMARKPKDGILLDTNTQAGATGSAKASLAPDGKSARLDFNGAGEQTVALRPVEGLWNLNEQLQVRVKVKNVGQTSVTPSVRLESESGPTDTVTMRAALAPGAEGEIVVPFASKLPWKGVVTANSKPDKSWGHIPGTGTEYRSNVTTGVTFMPDKTPGTKSLLVTSLVADLPELILPEWLGKRPPVEGDWVQTLTEDFDGKSIDMHRWNVYASNWWDKRMHFSKDQVIVEDGMLKLRLARKPGHHNDDPKGAFTDYAAGQIDTSGKWSQRYGYFEVREKQGTQKCLWPGFWMVADGQKKPGQNDGMEFDITEQQSSWGIHRFNIACHWDGYEKDHKSIGTSSNYVQADKEGFITVGLLWLPGQFVVYGNGKEIYRWENPRISDRPEMLIVQNEIGGWDNEDVDDSELPADFLVDYIRVWQRKDLASPDDGPKPNNGGPMGPQH